MHIRNLGFVSSTRGGKAMHIRSGFSLSLVYADFVCMKVSQRIITEFVKDKKMTEGMMKE